MESDARCTAAQRIALITIASLFAIGTSVLALGNARTRDLAPRFHWPDETSNAFFATRVARGEPIAVPEPRNRTSGNLIHQRTVNVRTDGALVPGAYLGLPLSYGFVGRVIGARAMLFITPVLAAFGLLAFAAMVRRLWGATIALLATVLLAFHPSLWLFTATTLLPNVPFVALVLMGFSVLLPPSSFRGEVAGSYAWARKYLVGIGVFRWLLGGLLFGLALTMRTHELSWIAALVSAVVWWQRPGWKAVAALLIGTVLPFIPILMLQQQLYGGAFTTGYALLKDGAALPMEFAPSAFPSWLRIFVAPFGWDVPRALTNAWRSLVAPHAWFPALAIVGMVVGWRWYRRWVLGTLVLVTWLLLYYGSWELADPLVRQTNVLTVSYVRYWIPVIVALAPWAAVGLRWITARAPARWRLQVAALVLLGIAMSTTAQAIRDPSEGLLRQQQAIAEYRTRARAVIAATELDAIIVSHRMDKVFFPERAVIHAPERPQDDPEFLMHLRALVPKKSVHQPLGGLVDRAPVYWYAPGEVLLPGFAVTSVDHTPFGERLSRIE